MAANLIVELPHGIAYSLGDDMVCIRTLDVGREVELPCEAISINEDRGAVLRSVRILGVCDQYYVCFQYQPL